MDVNERGAVECGDRFLKLLSVNNNKQIESLCFQILKLHLKNSVFLKYKPSKIAACAVIIACNIENKQPLTQTDIWESE